ncbi:MAG: hypothetical protein K9N09_01980 [Candidatus Cloacimonetes bacterium]|nr:hypothetical protein [Candidatus Cloacimonadota bacterium]MCF7813243.1 hypothetical protein [Candidatus Cloacimonadota bacterium]MCF7867442.1 hypothetical protein [Candidatus Cloacimonadota bacterium]MCF7882926.1 hypothetical protein [Candidatus Cloacimonadota bacterium]
MKKYIWLLILISLAVVQLHAGYYAGDFMVIGNGVRPLSMGGAFSAVANDCSAIYWNAAGLAQIRKSELSINHSFLYGNLASYDNFTFCKPLPNDVTVGINWTRLSISDIPVFLEEHLIYNVDFRSSFLEFNLPGQPDDMIKSADDLFQIAFAKHLHKDLYLGWLFLELPVDFNFGISAKYLNRKIDEYKGSGIGFDASILFKTSLAVIIGRSWLGEFAFGLNYQDISNTKITWNTMSNHSDEVEDNVKLGFAVIQPIKKFNSELVIAADIDYIYDNCNHYGIEYKCKDLVSMRMGINDNDFTTGLSVKLYDINIDYAFTTNVIGNTNRIGLRYEFDK